MLGRPRASEGSGTRSSESESESESEPEEYAGPVHEKGGVNKDFLNSLRVEEMLKNHPAMAPRLEHVIEAGRGLHGVDYLRAVLPSMQKLAKEREKEVMEWEEAPDKAFEKEWYEKTMVDAILEAKITKTPIHPKGPSFSFRSHPAGEYARHEYAWIVDGDEDAIPHRDQWKRVPPHAFKPGREFSMTNRARKLWGKEPLTEAQWAAKLAEREAEQAAVSPKTSRRGRKGVKKSKVEV